VVPDPEPAPELSGELDPVVTDVDADLPSALSRLVDDAIGLRMGAQLPRIDAAPRELSESLLAIRASLDRMESLLATALQLRGLAARQHTVADISVSDAWDQVAVRQRQSAARDEYSSAKERAAATNLEVLDLRRVERDAHRRLDLCDEAVDSIRLRHRGLQDVRADCLALIRLMQFESSLER
jgi:hypothetical protein